MQESEGDSLQKDDPDMNLDDSEDMDDFDEGLIQTSRTKNELSYTNGDFEEGLTTEDLAQKSITDIRTLWADAFKVPSMAINSQHQRLSSEFLPDLQSNHMTVIVEDSQDIFTQRLTNSNSVKMT